MKHLIVIGAAACALTLSVLPIDALPLAPITSAITRQADSDVIMVKRGGRGHHYGWTMSRGRHLGFTRGRHRGWR
jgi:hypothetical protein